jgi:hypothetical protein
MVKSGYKRLKKFIAKYDDLAYYYRIKSRQENIQDSFAKVSLKLAKIDENVYAFLNIYPLKWGKRRIWQKYFRRIVNRWDLLTPTDKQYFIKLLQLYKVPYDIVEKSEEKVEELKSLYEFCDPTAIHLEYYVEISQSPEKRLEYETELVKDTYLLDEWVYEALRQNMNEVIVNFRQGGKTDKMCHDLSESSITKLPTAILENDNYVDLEGEHAKEIPIESESGAELALDIYLPTISACESGFELVSDGYLATGSAYEIVLTVPLEYNFYLPISLTPESTYEFTLSFFLRVESQTESQTEDQTEEISINTSFELQLG